MNEITTSPAFVSLPPGLGHPGHRSVDYRESVLLSRQSTISLITAEGDKVSISADWSLAHQRGVSQAQKGGTLLSGYSLSTLEQQSYALRVQGDLNAEELGDIERLMAELTSIAYDFFNGDLEKAMQGAFTLGDMGSIREFSATFIQSTFTSQQLVSRGPRALGHLPPPAGSFAEAQAQLPAASEVYRYHDIIQAQWQQLKEWFEAETAGGGRLESTGGGKAEGLPPSERMLEALKATMRHHPRLTPLSRALAEKAMERAQELFRADQGSSPPPGAGEELRQRLGERLDNWLLT